MSKRRKVEKGGDNDDDDDDLKMAIAISLGPARDGGQSSSSSSQPVEEPVKSSRQKAQKEIAHSRAAHFARADVSSSAASSSTKKEGWPGPFSTAIEMLNQREEEKRKREAAMKEAQMNGVAIAVLTEASDEYDVLLAELVWPGKDRAKKKSHYTEPIPTLERTLVEFVAKNIDSVQDLEGLPVEVRSLLATELASTNKIHLSDVTSKLTARGCEHVILPQCSDISKHTLLEIIYRAAGKEMAPNSEGGNDDRDLAGGTAGSSANIKSICLKNCGFGFTSDLAEKIAPELSELESLTLLGCYRLKDESLVQILDVSKQSLRHLDLSINSRLGGLALKHIADFNMRTLHSLVLDKSSHLQDTDVSLLAQEGLFQRSDQLRRVSLSGLNLLTIQSVGPFIECYGASLTDLNLSHCSLLDDEVLVAIRASCSSLQHLSIAHLPLLSTAALVGLFLVAPEGEAGADRGIGRLASCDLSGTQTTDDVATQLCLLSQHTLESLSIGSCYQLRSKSFMALFRHCRRTLRALDMSFVRSVDEAAVGFLVDNSPSLKTLVVWGCRQLTERFYNHHVNYDLKIVGKFC